MDVIQKFLSTTGFSMLIEDPRPLVMILISCILLEKALNRFC